jgi:ribonuclease HII
MVAEQHKKPSWIIGIDEVGRGPLAGPVYVCAIAMPLALYKKARWKGLRDSKQLTELARERWHATAQRLCAKQKIRIALSSQSANHIDEFGITASIRACITIVLRDLALDPSDCLVLLDGGLKAPVVYCHQETVIRGDDTHKIISLASVVAKVTRDALMKQLHKEYPLYHWYRNKGYGTKAHQAALMSFGHTVLHRKSYLTHLTKQD